MRSIYCLGAVRALADSGYADRVRSVHTTSAGCVSGAVLLARATHGRSVIEMRDLLLDRLLDRRFINLWRLRNIVDVDYLLESVRTVTSLSATMLSAAGRPELVFEVGLTDARTGQPTYVDLARLPTDLELYEALRATMALPFLYHRKVRIQGRRFIDGGVSDPLPLLRALRLKPAVVITISCVAKTYLGWELEGRERKVIQLMPGVLPSSIRHLLLTRNPLAAAVEDMTQLGAIGNIAVVRVAPVDQRDVGQRLERDRRKLLALEDLGYSDAIRALGTLRGQAEQPMQVEQPIQVEQPMQVEQVEQARHHG
jgi:predicted patatin/cPLA2 family phospholipase